MTRMMTVGKKRKVKKNTRKHSFASLLPISGVAVCVVDAEWIELGLVLLWALLCA
jgi:hypothetical protein